MNSSQKIGRGRVTASLLALLILALVLSAGYGEAGICERALGKCLIDAGVPNAASMLGSGVFGLVTVIVLAQFCASGYLFCAQYY